MMNACLLINGWFLLLSVTVTSQPAKQDIALDNWGLDLHRSRFVDFSRNPAAIADQEDRKLFLAGLQKSKVKRVFGFKDKEAKDELVSCCNEHRAVWQEYLAECRRTNVAPSDDGFDRYKAEQDPFLKGLLAEVAPVFYFDFSSRDVEKEYLLDSIDVRTIDFVPAMGLESPFGDTKWYDITLSTKKGTKNYPMRGVGVLTVRRHGRAYLRLWVEKSTALSKQFLDQPLVEKGWFIIQISFNFRATGTGQKCTVATERFMTVAGRG